MIIRITFDDGSVMLFGNSYKPWTMQFDEYMWILKRNFIKIKPIKFESCKDKWIGWGGLKWCPENLFQEQLNREYCQEYEPDNLKPRQYKKMRFVENNIIKNTAFKIIKQNGFGGAV